MIPRILLLLITLLFVSCSNPADSSTDDGDTTESNTKIIDMAQMLDYPFTYTTEWPNENNTGLKGVGLTKEELTYSRSLHLHKDGKIITNGKELDPTSDVANHITIDLDKSTITIEGLDIFDGIFIYEDCNIQDVIIRKCYITSVGSYGISMKSRTTYTLIEDCTINGNGNPSKGILARNAIVKRCDISQYQDGVYMSTNIVLDRNYVHNLHTFDGAHADATQCSGPGNILMVNNTLDAIGHNACLMSSNQEGDLINIQLENNTLLGGNYNVYIRDKDNGSYLLQDHLVKNNIFQNENNKRYISYAEDPTHNIVITGNTNENGTLIPMNNYE